MDRQAGKLFFFYEILFMLDRIFIRFCVEKLHVLCRKPFPSTMGGKRGFGRVRGYAIARLFLALVKIARICYDKNRNAE